MKNPVLPVKYSDLSLLARRTVREAYILLQYGKCWYCDEDIHKPAPERIKSKQINWDLFPKGFLDYPIHLQHDHKTGMTEGAVHNYCNAVLWQYERK